MAFGAEDEVLSSESYNILTSYISEDEVAFAYIVQIRQFFLILKIDLKSFNNEIVQGTDFIKPVLERL